MKIIVAVATTTRKQKRVPVVDYVPRRRPRLGTLLLVRQDTNVNACFASRMFLRTRDTVVSTSYPVREIESEVRTDA